MPGTETPTLSLHEAVMAEREACAKLVDDFSWTLPMYADRTVNIASDDAAESVKEQIAAAIRGQTAQPGADAPVVAPVGAGSSSKLIEQLRDPRFIGQEGMRAVAADRIVELEGALRDWVEAGNSHECRDALLKAAALLSPKEGQQS